MKSAAFSFRLFLLAIALLGTLPTLAFAGFLLLRYTQSERQRAEHLLVENTKGIAVAIEGEFAAAQAALLAVRDLSDIDDLVGFETRLRRNAAETGRQFALLSRGGEQLINTSLRPGETAPPSRAQLWAPIFSEGRTVVTDIFAGVITRNLLVGVGVPVVRDGVVKWALVSTHTPTDFTSIMKEAGVPADWVVSIVDRHGTIFLRSRNSEQFAGQPVVPELVDFLQRDGSGTLITTSHEGIPLITAAQHAGMSGWAVAVGLPVANLEGPLRATFQELIAAGLAVLAIALALVFLVARVTDRAMLGLTAAAEGVGRREIVEPPLSIVAETNAVAGVLSRTSRVLHDLTAGLEAQVEERTRQLSLANASLTAEIERRRETEAQVVQMQKIDAVGRLTGGIAHDFNNMLAVVLGSLQLMQRRLDRGDTNVHKYIDHARQGAERAANLTARLLAFSRQQPLAPGVIDVNKLLSGMDEILRRTIPESVQIETVLAAGAWRTHADVQILESAIINLVVNARDAMPDGGKLTIETANAYLDETYVATRADVKPGQYVMIAVADTGIGMAPEVAQRAFDPFFTTKPAGQGTGLGLSQVHGFIKQSSGHVAIYSEPGQGTTIKLYLPRHFGDAQPAEDKAPAAIPRAQNRETILVVEDEGEVRKVTLDMLRELGYRTLDAENGTEALAQLDRHPDIALLFTDVVMPGMNGRQLATEVLSRRPGLPVLFTTGYTRNAIVHHGILDPGVHVIMKPHTLEALGQKISELLAGRVEA